MYEFFFSGFEAWQIGMLCLCALLVGMNKCGVPGIAIINVPLLAIMFGAKESTGLILPLLALADVFAVIYHRRHAKWNIILKLLPWALAGIFTGSIIIEHINNAQLKPIIGFIVLAMLVMNWLRNWRKGGDIDVPRHIAFAATMGFAAGLTTQLANAAGPIMVIYLLAMQLTKEEYIGTGAWFFLILNWLKIPLFIWDGRITMETFRADLGMIPFIIAGSVIGIIIFKKLPQKWFNIIIQLLALCGALKLCYSVKDLF